MDYLSLFSGIGGFEYGIQQSNKNKSLNCIGFSEIDKYAKSIYTRHFPKHKNYGNATEIRTEDLPTFDLLVGGFPCQAFSVAGKRRGFDDTRGTLFFEIARILRDKRPRYFLLENVKGLLSHDKGKTFQTILRTLTQLGYDVQWEIFNSKNHGVPQNRERLYIKGFLTTRSRSRREVLSLRKATKEINVQSETELIQVNECKGAANRVFNPNGLACTLTDNEGGLGAKTGLYIVDKPIYTELKNKSFVRKYPVDTIKLQKVLREHKKKKGLSNKKISETLCIPKTEVDHWFRTDKYSSIPSSNVWFNLKELLEINTSEFDDPITVFEIKDSNYDMGKRVYTVESICPSLLSSPPAIKIVGNVSKNGKSQSGAIYSENGLVGALLCSDYKDPKKVLLTDKGARVIAQDYQIRKLTPIECERLQGFPDNWTQYGANDELISDTQRYKCCGNAVTTNVVTHIFNTWDMTF